MKKNRTVDLELARKMLDYDPKTGVFRWRVKPSGNVRIGDAAGCKTYQGYIAIGVGKTTLKAHRLAWAYVYGEEPQIIDHINGVKSDNRICNLRSVDTVENAQNRRAPKKGASSRLLGAFKHRDKWSSAIKVGDKRIYLGRFDTELSAHIAYIDAKRKHHKANQL